MSDDTTVTISWLRCNMRELGDKKLFINFVVLLFIFLVTSFILASKATKHLQCDKTVYSVQLYLSFGEREICFLAESRKSYASKQLQWELSNYEVSCFLLVAVELFRRKSYQISLAATWMPNSLKFLLFFLLRIWDHSTLNFQRLRKLCCFVLSSLFRCVRRINEVAYDLQRNKSKFQSSALEKNQIKWK